MIAFYADAEKEVLLLKSEANFITLATQTDDFRGGDRRTVEGVLRSWEEHSVVFEETIEISNLNQADRDIVKGLIDNKTDFYYVPDTAKRADEIYFVRISRPFSAGYDKVVGTYSMTLRLRGVQP